MENLKKYEEFINKKNSINENSNTPFNLMHGMERIYLGDDELHMFGLSEFESEPDPNDPDDAAYMAFLQDLAEPSCVKLLKSGKIQIHGNELWYDPSDATTKRKLKNMIPEAFE